MPNNSFLKSSICLFLFMLSPAVSAHIADFQILDMQDGLLHVLLEPSYLTLTLLIVFMLAVVLRYKVMEMTEKFLK